MRRSTRYNRPGLSGSARSATLLGADGDGSTLTLDFTTGILDSRLSFTRNSTATYINSQGYVATMAAAPTNDPTKARFDHDPTTLAPKGLLIEGQSVNLATYSEDYSQAAWSKVNIARTTGQSSPDNATGATLIAENTTSFVKHSLERSITITPGVHTFSVWAKEPSTDSRRYLCVQVADGQATAARYTIVADLQAGTITAFGANNGTAGAPTSTGHSITAYPNGWYRLTVTMNCVASPLYPAVMLSNISTLFGGSNQPFYSATTPYTGIIVWGVQLEAASGASSYIFTGASQGTRNADFCTMPTSSFITGNPYPNTLFVDCIPATANSGFPDIVRLFDQTGGGTFSYGNEIYYYSAATMNVNRKVTASTNTDRTLQNGLAYNTRHKFATAIDSSSFIGSRDGGTDSGAATAPAALASVITHLGVGNSGGSTAINVMNGCIRQIKFWPTALPQATLNALTTL